MSIHTDQRHSMGARHMAAGTKTVATIAADLAYAAGNPCIAAFRITTCFQFFHAILLGKHFQWVFSLCILMTDNSLSSCRRVSALAQE